MAASSTASRKATASAATESHEKQQSKDRVITRKRAILGRGQPALASVKPLAVLFVGTKAPFMSVVKRAIKTLDQGPGGSRWSSTKVKSLPERIAQAQEAPIHSATTTAAAGASAGASYKTARQREVVILGTGHVLSKLVLVAAWFQRQEGYVVTVRTRSAVSIDDVFTFVGGKQEGEDENDEETGDAIDEAADTMDVDVPSSTTTATAPTMSQPQKSTRLRNMSCLEVAVRLK
ncbi:hypothetical protein Sste5346_009875 [Sporothrix stenoceras]|uniref:Uncharacterized protein n=1 Tax=Sporothrix stenoceras TaxID=5173 RepID=A0ABR3YIS6_9PEZI